MHDADVGAIVAGLTKAQRALVRRGSAGGDESMRTVEACMRKGLMYLRIDSPDGKHGFVENTDLGNQAARILANADATGGGA